MLKKVLLLSIAVVFVVAQVGLASAAGTGTSDTGPGCGWGKLAFQNYPHARSKGIQILMATTNGILGNQTFGITSGTGGCTDDGTWWAQQKTLMFAELNFEALTQEMAQGRGEHLASLATLMGVPAGQQPEFFAMTQERYTSLIQAGETSPLALVKALNEGISASPVLKVSMNR
jgi:hypothetical protein